MVPTLQENMLSVLGIIGKQVFWAVWDAVATKSLFGAEALVDEFMGSGHSTRTSFFHGIQHCVVFLQVAVHR